MRGGGDCPSGETFKAAVVQWKNLWEWERLFSGGHVKERGSAVGDSRGRRGGKAVLTGKWFTDGWDGGWVGILILSQSIVNAIKLADWQSRAIFLPPASWHLTDKR